MKREHLFGSPVDGGIDTGVGIEPFEVADQRSDQEHVTDVSEFYNQYFH